MIIFSFWNKELSVSGSLSKTSKAAPASLPSSTALTTSFSSTSPPLAQLMIRAVGLTLASCSAPISWVVVVVSGTWSERKSASARSWFSGAKSTLILRAKSVDTKGSWAITCISNAWALLATSEPTLPKPTMPNVLFLSSTPISFSLCHLPDLSWLFASGTLRARASIRAMVCSAADTVLAVGALTTTIPFLVAASTSILSVPTPALPITFSFSPRSMISAPTLVWLRTTKAS